VEAGKNGYFIICGIAQPENPTAIPDIGVSRQLRSTYEKVP
jgi:hypothetical protein